MKYVCITCDQEFDDIPAGAVQLTPGEHRVNTYRFADGTIHSIRKIHPMVAEGIHKRWHKKSPRPDCVFCNPPAKPEPPVVEQTQEVVEVLTALPQPKIEEVKPASESEIEVVPATTMAAAFHRIFKS